MRENNEYYLKIETPRNMTMEKLKKKLIKQGHQVTLIGQRYGNPDSQIEHKTYSKDNYGDLERIVDETKHYGKHKRLNFQWPHDYDLIESEDDFLEISLEVISDYEAKRLNGLLLHAFKEQVAGDDVRKIGFHGSGFDLVISIDDIIPWRE